MNWPSVLLTPLLLLVPTAVLGEARLKAGMPVSGRLPEPFLGPREPVQHQVSIEQHIIIRITPLGPGANGPRGAPPPGPPPFTPLHRPKSRAAKAPEIGTCVPASSIAGVEVTPKSRLLLYLRDQRIVTAQLEKGCSPDEFYSGFYVERTLDGQICSGRDRLHSRSGTVCRLTHFRQIADPDGR